MRGAPAGDIVHVAVLGIIPADAGSTQNTDDCKTVIRDHPRGCGEHAVSVSTRSILMGSSPRMRGARRLRSAALLKGRIIPADAGSTLSGSKSISVARDHPRGCGEHLGLRKPTGRFPGSSPRMRGAQPGRRHHPVGEGIIPADAGSTRPGDDDVEVGIDHPRGCGEHPPDSTPDSRGAGSSPRMRGAHSRHRRPPGAPRLRRIIPADAGSTTMESWTKTWSRDHPRGCGEHLCGRIRPPRIRGSSPRMRGAPG